MDDCVYTKTIGRKSRGKCRCTGKKRETDGKNKFVVLLSCSIPLVSLSLVSFVYDSRNGLFGTLFRQHRH
jgi:hypothetical protein